MYFFINFLVEFVLNIGNKIDFDFFIVLNYFEVNR